MNKNKQIIIALAVAIIILLGAGGFFALSQNNKKPALENSTVSAPEEKNNSMMASSMIDIMKSGGTTQCSFNYKTENGGSSEGKFYISGNNVQGDINSTTSTGKTTNVKMIKNGDTTYIWGDSLPLGVKVTMSVDDLVKNDQINQYFNANQKGNFKCTSWTADPTIFVAPKNIKFTDMSSVMKGTIQKNTSLSPSIPANIDQAKCAVCNNLSGDTKTTCLQQLNCK